MAHPAERRCDPDPGATRLPKRRSSEAPPRFTGQKVLIVDDDRAAPSRSAAR